MCTGVQFFLIQKTVLHVFIKTDGWFCNDWNNYSFIIFRGFFMNFSFHIKQLSRKMPSLKPLLRYNCYHYLQWMMLCMQSVCWNDLNYKLFVDRLWICSIHEKVRASQHKLWFLRVLGPRGTGGGAIRWSAGRHLEHG